MNSKIWGVVGCGGFGRETLPVARDVLGAQGEALDQLVFIDDAPDRPEIVNGHRTFSYAEFRSLSHSRKFAVIAVGDGAVRARIAKAMDADGIEPWTIKASNAVILDDVEIASGAVLSPFVTLTSNIAIGRHFHCNLYSYVAHDCRIGDYVTFAPGVKCNGNVVVEDFAYIGTGAILKQGRPGHPLVIGRGAVVGMGAVVTKDVAPGATVVGNPARPLIKSTST